MPFETRDARNDDADDVSAREDVLDDTVELKRRHRISFEEQLVPAIVRSRVAHCVHEPSADPAYRTERRDEDQSEHCSDNSPDERIARHHMTDDPRQAERDEYKPENQREACKQ